MTASRADITSGRRFGTVAEPAATASAGTTETAGERIAREVTGWPRVEAGTGRRGEFAFTVDGREIGHLHGDRAAHFGFPRELGSQLLAAGRVSPHPVNPHSPKMAARPIRGDADVDEVIALMRLNYERVTAG